MSAFLWIVSVVVVIVWVISIADIIRRRMDAAHTAGWLLIVVLLPILGSLVYWALRRPTDSELDETLGARADLRRGRPAPPGGGTRPT
jgi:Phospholipase_D-nuclease N-terminal